jgi:microcystin degradation protein MlrC
MRIAIAGFLHETNTYVATPTSVSDFLIYRGPEMLEAFAGTSTNVGVAAAIISANSPGLSSARVGDFERARAGRGLYPLDLQVAYEPAVAA